MMLTGFVFSQGQNAGFCEYGKKTNYRKKGEMSSSSFRDY